MRLLCPLLFGLLWACALNDRQGGEASALRGGTDDIESRVCQKGDMPYPLLHGLFSIKTDGSNLTLLSLAKPFVTPEGEVVNLAYDKVHVSPDGKKLVFLQCVADQSKVPGGDCLCDKREYLFKQVVVSDFDGANQSVVGAPKSGRMNEYPNWSPDGSKVLFVQSASANPLDTDLFTYDLAKRELKNLTNTPCSAENPEHCMETDNFWNEDGSVTVVKNRLDWHQDDAGNWIPEFAEPNNLFQFSASRPTQIAKLTDFSESLGQHCCVADPKRHPSDSRLTYAEFEKTATLPNGDTQRVWNIITRTGDTQRTQLTESRFENLYPLWSHDGSKLVWTTWDQETKRSMKVVKDFASPKTPPTEIVLIGPGSETLRLLGEKIYFTAVGWQDWLNPSNDTLVFPASFVATPELKAKIGSQLGN